MNQASHIQTHLSEIDRNLSKFRFQKTVVIPQSVPVGERVTMHEIFFFELGSNYTGFLDPVLFLRGRTSTRSSPY